MTPGSFASFGDYVGKLLLGAAGGVATAEARAAASACFSPLQAAGPLQLVDAWVAPPLNRPELGGARLFLAEFSDPSRLAAAWSAFEAALRPDSPVAQAFAQMGWVAALIRDGDDPMAAELRLSPPAGGPAARVYLDARYVARLNGNWLAVVAGDAIAGGETRDTRLEEYRAGLAADAAASRSEGMPEARDAFTRMGPGGAAFIAILDPVRFFQLALAETADWRPRTLDQPESPSALLAREILEYASGGAWNAVGESGSNSWRIVGGMSWDSLTRLSAALGVTEAIGARE